MKKPTARQLSLDKEYKAPHPLAKLPVGGALAAGATVEYSDEKQAYVVVDQNTVSATHTIDAAVFNAANTNTTIVTTSVNAIPATHTWPPPAEEEVEVCSMCEAVKDECLCNTCPSCEHDMEDCTCHDCGDCGNHETECVCEQEEDDDCQACGAEGEGAYGCGSCHLSYCVNCIDLGASPAVCKQCKVEVDDTPEIPEEVPPELQCTSCGGHINALPNQKYWLNKCGPCRNWPIIKTSTSRWLCMDCLDGLKQSRCPVHYQRYIKRLKSSNPWADHAERVHSTHAGLGSETKSTQWKIALEWGIDLPTAQSPLQGFADFYLLNMIVDQVLSPGDRSPAAMVLAERVAPFAKTNLMYWDHQLSRYLDMALGGELRHHKKLHWLLCSSGGASRMMAWRGWLEIRRECGPEALAVAAEFFEGFHKGGFGGGPWANIARLCYKRQTNQIDRRTFLDQAWSIMHNGGNALDKMNWHGQNEQPRDGTAGVIQSVLGPAQANDNWEVLRRVASAPVNGFFEEYVRTANEWRRLMGMRLVTRNGVPPHHTLETVFEMYVTQRAAARVPRPPLYEKVLA